VLSAARNRTPARVRRMLGKSVLDLSAHFSTVILFGDAVPFCGHQITEGTNLTGYI
jgi:hypothetical protein